MAKTKHSLFGIRIQIQEQSLAARKADNRPLAKALDKIGVRLERTIKGYVADKSDDYDGAVGRLLQGVVGVVVANSDAQQLLWELNTHREDKREWKSSGGGPMVNVAIIADRPVWIALSILESGGHKLLMVDPTSPIICHSAIRTWLKRMLPESAYKYSRNEDRYVLGDAGNFFSMLANMDYADKQAGDRKEQEELTID